MYIYKINEIYLKNSNKITLNTLHEHETKKKNNNKADKNKTENIYFSLCLLV